MGRGNKKMRTVTVNGAVVTDENGEARRVSASGRRTVSRQARSGIQNTITPNGEKVRVGRNGSVSVTGGTGRVRRQNGISRADFRNQVGSMNKQQIESMAGQLTANEFTLMNKQQQQWYTDAMNARR